MAAVQGEHHIVASHILMYLQPGFCRATEDGASLRPGHKLIFYAQDDFLAGGIIGKALQCAYHSVITAHDLILFAFYAYGMHHHAVYRIAQGLVKGGLELGQGLLPQLVVQSRQVHAGVRQMHAVGERNILRPVRQYVVARDMGFNPKAMSLIKLRTMQGTG